MPTTNGVSDVMGIPVVDIGTLDVEDVIVVVTLGVVDATIGVSDTYMAEEEEAAEVVDIKVV